MVTALKRRDEMLGIVTGTLAPAPINNTRNFKRYTNAQTGERDDFIQLLIELARTLPDIYQSTGRPRHSPSDVLFALIYRTYRGVSTRRFTCDLRDCYERGFIEKPLHYNSVSDYLRNPSLTPVLHSLIHNTAAAFAHIETSFAVDSTGFPVPQITKWHDAKYGWRRRREWVKCHAMVGVQSHIVVSVEVTERSEMDQSQFKSLVTSTADRFPTMAVVAADRIYSTVSNLEHVESHGGLPAIPFRVNTNPFRHDPKSTWSRMFHLFALKDDDFQAQLNKQNQAESTFSAIKRRFGDKMFSRDPIGQTNEVLCKVLAHNMCVVLYWLHQFGVTR